MRLNVIKVNLHLDNTTKETEKETDKEHTINYHFTCQGTVYIYMYITKT